MTTDYELKQLLNAATKNGHTAIVKLLLSLSSPDINGPDYQGMAALPIGVLKQHREMGGSLLSVKGMEVNRTNKYGWTAL